MATPAFLFLILFMRSTSVASASWLTNQGWADEEQQWKSEYLFKCEWRGVMSGIRLKRISVWTLLSIGCPAALVLMTSVSSKQPWLFLRCSSSGDQKSVYSEYIFVLPDNFCAFYSKLLDHFFSEIRSSNGGTFN